MLAQKIYTHMHYLYVPLLLSIRARILALCVFIGKKGGCGFTCMVAYQLIASILSVASKYMFYRYFKVQVIHH